jgi:1-acyl-sn-glycerol-3-phosphate acyltransferase
MLLLRSLLFYAVMTVLTLLFAPAVFLAAPLSVQTRQEISREWVRLNLVALDKLCGLRHEVVGGGNLPQGTAIVFAKHQSAWETLAFQLIFPPLAWVLKRELLRIPVFGWALSLMKPIAIDRGAGGRAIRQMVSQGQARLGEGLWIVVFPEGTRVAPGAHRRYRMGGAVLAQQSGAPVVPVAHNAGRFWPRRGLIKHPGTITVHIGPPIATKGRSAAEINALAEEWIESRMKELEGEARSAVSSTAAAGG